MGEQGHRIVVGIDGSESSKAVLHCPVLVLRDGRGGSDPA
jgi:hypothetical protein